MSKLSRKDALAALERGDAAALGLPAAEVERARALLGSADLAGLGALPEALLELAVAHAGAHGKQDLLAAASASPHKALAKAAKKELYRLRSEGQAVEVPRPSAEPRAAAGPEPESWPAFASCVVVDGRRAFIAARPDPRQPAQLEVWTGEVSDREGVTFLQRGPMTRRNYKQLAREHRGGRAAGLSWQEVSPAQLGGLVARHLAHQKEPRPDDLELLARAFPGRAEDAEPASARWPELEGSAERGAVATSSELFLEPEVMTWLPSDAALQHLAARLDEVSVSRLVVDEAQRRQQADHAVGHEVEASATPEERERLAQRLFATADLLAAQGREPRARQAAAVARALRAGAPTEEIPFLRTLFEKALMEQIEGALARMSPELQARARAMAERQGAEGMLVEGAGKSEPSSERTPGGLIIPSSRD